MTQSQLMALDFRDINRNKTLLTMNSSHMHLKENELRSSQLQEMFVNSMFLYGTVHEKTINCFVYK